MRVGYLGPDGTVSHEALMATPGAEAFELAPQATLHEAVIAVHDGAVERALVPIENSLEGSVNPTLDALAFE
ncbi:MAG TPA: prephenate dehydratase domain-containing protein, partial [Solirubrobacteraceae bacterium]|nr:prephenate dehydratase domain-containing protein [Solirubrobacteraceae bacterium]